MNDTLSNDDRFWGMLCHLSALAGHFFPFGNIIAPLVIWLIKKDESAYVNYHGKEALNFQISLAIYFAIAVILAFVLIGFAFLIALWVFGLVMVIVAGVKANEGQYYRYPLTMRFLK